MKHDNGRIGTKLLVFLPLVALCILMTLIAVPLFAFGYLDCMLHGPRAVLSVASPDSNYEAYVAEYPSIDPPNQACFVERADKTHFMCIADLAEDIDCIQHIVWSPDSEVVVFHSQDYLTATRVSDWQTVRLFLGREWKRSQPDRRSTFSSGGVKQQVETIEFPGAGQFAYRLKGDSKLYTVRMDSLIQL